APFAATSLAPSDEAIALAEKLRDGRWKVSKSKRLDRFIAAARKDRDDTRVSPEEITRYIRRVTGTPMMSLQRVEHGQLKLCGTHGFDRRFIDYFDIVEHGSCSCGAAFQAMRQIVV